MELTVLFKQGCLLAMGKKGDVEFKHHSTFRIPEQISSMRIFLLKMYGNILKAFRLSKIELLGRKHRHGFLIVAQRELTMLQSCYSIQKKNNTMPIGKEESSDWSLHVLNVDFIQSTRQTCHTTLFSLEAVTHVVFFLCPIYLFPFDMANC